MTDSSRACAEVVGTTLTVEVNDKGLCIGAKDADHGRAVNGAQVGDCLTLRGDEAERSPCVTGSRPVLEVLKNQLRSTGGGSDLAFLCQGSDEAEQVYGWTLESVPPALVGRYDLVFCLGPAKS